MQKVVGSSPISRLEKPCKLRGFSLSASDSLTSQHAEGHGFESSGERPAFVWRCRRGVEPAKMSPADIRRAITCSLPKRAGIYCESLPCPCGGAGQTTKRTPTTAQPPATIIGRCRRGRLAGRSCSPGKVATSDVGRICRPGYTGRVRNVSENTKSRVYSEYGIRRPRARRVRGRPHPPARARRLELDPQPVPRGGEPEAWLPREGPRRVCRLYPPTTLPRRCRYGPSRRTQRWSSLAASLTCGRDIQRPRSPKMLISPLRLRGRRRRTLPAPPGAGCVRCLPGQSGANRGRRTCWRMRWVPDGARRSRRPRA
jgi:hypothetical protein